MTPLLHSIPEAARRLSIGRSKFYEIIETGAIKTVKLGARRLIAETELERFVASLENSATQRVA